MRLKSLELNGYKTFASRTLFEFAGPITAIVGPNGSGKSNIADALRWVLGEQSYSVLRGRKTEDMIFSGSEKRPRSGMASVNITFDNSEGWLPIDFSEVSVTRRAYRDGQNEYLINQQRVRLKDVSELLSQSALSERTYTIIGQGLLDTALTLKSDERRRLFEEAAGIGLYRARKEQSLRRLDATLRNLERVEDILAELKPRLRSLEKQAERALEFSKLRSELRSTLREWYGFHWNRAQAELHERRQEADGQEKHLDLARQKQAELSRELNELRNRTQGVRLQLNEWHRRVAELHAGREGASRGLAVADERQRALAERREALKEERQRLESELSGLRSRLLEAEQDVQRYQTEQQDAQSRLDEARRILGERQAVQQDNEAKTQALRDRIAQLQGQLTNSGAQRESLKARIERSQMEINELERTLQGLETDLQAARELQQKADQSVVDAENKLIAIQNNQTKLDNQINELTTQIQHHETTRNNLTSKRAQLLAEIQGLEQAELAAAGFAEGAKLLLQAAKEKRLRLGKGTLGREIRVPEKYEVAIASALGAYLDAVLLDEQDPEEALSLLESREASGALLPLSLLNLDGRNPAITGHGFVGIAADFVEASPDLKPAVELLLGNVLVAEDRKAARRLLAENPQAVQAVTLRGELFSRGGQIEVRSPKTAAGLARPRAERELRAQVETAEKEIAKLEDSINTLQQKKSDLNGQRKLLEDKLDEAQTAHEAARREVQGSSLDLEQLQRQRDWFSAQLRTTQGEEAQASAQIETLLANEKLLVGQVAKVEKDLEDHLHSLVDLPMEEQHAQVAHWEMRLAVGQRALQEAQRRTSERQQALQRAEAQLAAQQERSKELEEQYRAIEIEKAHLGKQEGGVGEEIEAIQAQIAPAETDLSQSDAQLTQLQAAETQALQALSAAERTHTQAQIALGRQQETLESLRSRIEDDFGLVAFQYEAEVSGPTPLPLGELVEELPVVESLAPDLEETLKTQRAQIRRLGSVNPEAQNEFLQVKERVESMQEQVKDLRAAEVDLKKVIAELDLLMEKEFRTTFDKVAAEFREIFARLFNGGSAKLLLTEEEDMSNTGIDIEARLPGKRSQRLALLSGGERSLTAAALVFSLLKAAPTPFCVMDEVDAMLDEANVGRFTDVLRELSRETQFVLITHNRNTVQVADVIYGVTMGRDTASQVISLRLDEVDERYSE
ncbi:MAG: chromosome segregation protein SMC [Chloroflexi bacterium]|nr:chromosome segregation protein SMC [Chloroflexota bacterium]